MLCECLFVFVCECVHTYTHTGIINFIIIKKRKKKSNTDMPVICVIYPSATYISSRRVTHLSDSGMSEIAKWCAIWDARLRNTSLPDCIHRIKSFPCNIFLLLRRLSLWFDDALATKKISCKMYNTASWNVHFGINKLYLSDIKVRL